MRTIRIGYPKCIYDDFIPCLSSVIFFLWSKIIYTRLILLQVMSCISEQWKGKMSVFWEQENAAYIYNKGTFYLHRMCIKALLDTASCPEISPITATSSLGRSWWHSTFSDSSPVLSWPSHYLNYKKNWLRQEKFIWPYHFQH